MQMTKAMYKIGNTFEEMIALHNKEIENHQVLIDRFREEANKTKNQEKMLVYLLEAHRNKEHQKGHIKMVSIYEYLRDTK